MNTAFDDRSIAIIPLIVTPDSTTFSVSLKRAALLFDTLSAQDLSIQRARGRTLAPEKVAELDWLVENGIAIEDPLANLSTEASGPDDKERLERLLREHAALFEAVATDSTRDMELLSATLPDNRADLIALKVQLIEVLHRSADLGARATAALLRTFYERSAVALISAPSTLPPDSALATAVMRVVIRSLPEPSEETPWQDILDFKQDPDARAALLRLKVWMNRRAFDTSPEHVLVDEVQSHLAEYEAHMKLHRLKCTRGRLEALVTSGAEMLEDLSRFKFGSIARTIFGMSKESIQLIAAEQGAPGRDIAYIVHAATAFGEAPS